MPDTLLVDGKPFKLPPLRPRGTTRTGVPIDLARPPMRPHRIATAPRLSGGLQNDNTPPLRALKPGTIEPGPHRPLPPRRRRIHRGMVDLPNPSRFGPGDGLLVLQYGRSRPLSRHGQGGVTVTATNPALDPQQDEPLVRSHFTRGSNITLII